MSLEKMCNCLTASKIPSDVSVIPIYSSTILIQFLHGNENILSTILSKLGLQNENELQKLSGVPILEI